MLIALHLLQNHAPSNLNRDDNNEPKDALFGGVRRARISSQALKRSIRWSEHFRGPFEERGLSHLLAMRTLLLPELIEKRLNNMQLTAQEKQAIVEATERLGKAERASSDASTEEAGAKGKKKDRRGKGKAGDASGAEAASSASAEEAGAEGERKGRRGEDEAGDAGGAERRKTAQLMFFTDADVAHLAERLIAIVHEKGVEELRKLEGDNLVKAIGEYEPHSVDIAMFGRMTTSSPFKDVEAAVQVAHAISTHAIEMEFDFYTAVDDVSGEAGAGFIGDTTFNSATYYKYFSINWENLVQNLQKNAGIAAMAVHALIRAAMFAIPSGKQNSFAAHNLPDLALVEVRPDNIPLNYANAFVKPVRATPNLSLIEASALALQNYIPTINGIYGLQAQRAFLSSVPFDLDGAVRCATLDDLLNWLTKQGVRP